MMTVDRSSNEADMWGVLRVSSEQEVQLSASSELLAPATWGAEPLSFVVNGTLQLTRIRVLGLSLIHI